jgi:hypothetical protein
MEKGKKQIQLENGRTVSVLRNNFPISNAKFRKIAEEKGLTFKEIGEKIGYVSNSISSALQSGYMNSIMIKGIENTLGIKYEEYAYIPPEKPVEKPQYATEAKPEETPVQQSMLPSDALYDTVKSAVIDAINEAIAGNMKNLRGCFYTAVYSAINAAKKEA